MHKKLLILDRNPLGIQLSELHTTTLGLYTKLGESPNVFANVMFFAICNVNIFANYRKIHFRNLCTIWICSKYDKLKNIGLVCWINLPDVFAFDIGKIQRFQWLLEWILEQISGNPGRLEPGAFHCCCCYY